MSGSGPPRGPATVTVTFDFDATLVTARSEKQDAAATYKRIFGFHPLAVWLDETAEPLAAMLRPGNAGANNAADHMRLLCEAIDALPGHYQQGHRPGDDPATVRVPLLVRADSAGAAHDFLDAVVAATPSSPSGSPSTPCRPRRHRVLPGRRLDPRGRP